MPKSRCVGQSRQLVLDGSHVAQLHGFQQTTCQLRVESFGHIIHGCRRWCPRRSNRHDLVDNLFECGVERGESGSEASRAAGFHGLLFEAAARVPDGPNLDRVQVIKGWLDSAGETHERIYDVACSDGRTIVNRRCDRDVGSTVNLSEPSYTNTIGDPLLTAHWVDPDFDPTQRTFYYVRVIEIPKPRWTAYDAARFGLDLPDDVAMTVQDRAYTSPIWYTP